MNRYGGKKRKYFLGGMFNSANPQTGTSEFDTNKFSTSVGVASQGTGTPNYVDASFIPDSEKNLEKDLTGVAENIPIIGGFAKAGSRISSGIRGDETSGVRNAIGDQLGGFNTVKAISSGNFEEAIPIAGGFFKAKRRKREKEEEERNNRLRAISDIERQSRGVLSGYPTTGVEGASFAKGGRIMKYGIPKVLEGGNIEMLSSDVAKFNGNTHAQGGIDLDIDNDGNAEVEVEDNETIFEDKILSDKLKPTDSVKEKLKESGVRIYNNDTYADIGNRIGNLKGKFEKKIETGSGLAFNTAKLMLDKLDSSIDNLYQDQELSKQSNDNIQFANGGTIPSKTSNYLNEQSLEEQKSLYDKYLTVENPITGEIQKYGDFRRSILDTDRERINAYLSDPIRVQQTGKELTPEQYVKEQFDKSRNSFLRKAAETPDNFLISEEDRNLMLDRAFDRKDKNNRETTLMETKRAKKLPSISLQEGGELTDPKEESSLRETVGDFLIDNIPLGREISRHILDYDPDLEAAIEYQSQPEQIERQQAEIDKFKKKMMELNNSSNLTSKKYGGKLKMQDGGKTPNYVRRIGKEDLDLPIGYTKENFDLSPIDLSVTTDNTPNIPTENKVGNFLENNIGNLMAVGSTLSNQSIINKLETEQSPELISNPNFRYTDRSSVAYNRNASSLRNALKGVDQGSSQNINNVKASLLARKLEADNQIAMNENARRDQALERYEDRRYRTEAINSNIRNKMAFENLTRRNEQRALTQQNLDALSRSIVGNQYVKDQKELDAAKALLIASRDGNRGTVDRLLKQYPQLRKVLGLI